MQRIYVPDGWILMKINGPTPHYRVFASWYGGYLNGDRWRINSGITKVTEDGGYYLFEGSSDSLYKCHKQAYAGISSYNRKVLRRYADQDYVEILKTMPENIMEIDYIIS